MPGGMPGNVEKGFILEMIDEYVNGLTKDQVQDLCDEIKIETNNKLEDLAQAKLGNYPGTTKPRIRDIDKTHLKDDWFDARGNRVWWRKFQPIAPIIRFGLVKALDRKIASESGGVMLPLDSYWLCAGSTMEVAVCVSSAQVTMLIMTPTLPGPRRLRQPDANAHYQYGSPENIWIVKQPAGHPGETEDDGSNITRQHRISRPRRLKQKNYP